MNADQRGRVMALLEQALPAPVYQTWCRDLDLREVGENELQIPVPNPFYRDWLERELRAPLEEIFRQVFGRVPEISFQVVPGLELPLRSEAVAAAAAERPSALPPRGAPAFSPAGGALPDPDRPSFNRAYTFETFITGPSNRLAHAAALAVSEKPGRTYNPLFIHGGVGLGKTHLLQALCQALLERNPHARILYLSCEQFVNDYISSIEKKRIEAFRARCRSADLLVVDDVHFLRGKEASQEEFFHTFNSLHLTGRQIVLSSDSPPKDIRTLKDHLVSRFSSGFSVSIDPPTFEMRVAIAKRIADAMQKELPGDVLSYVAGAVQSNVRELAGAVNRIIGIASLSHRPVDLALAKETLGGERFAAPGRAADVARIQELVAKHYGRKIEELTARTWRKSTSLARQVSMFLCKRHTELSLAEISQRFGRKDHTTVLYAIRRIEALMAERPALRRDIEELSRQIGG